MSYPNPAPENHPAAKAWFQRNSPDGFVLNRVWRIENTNGSRWQVAYTSTLLPPIAKNALACKKLFSSRFVNIFKYLTIISNECEDHYWCVTFGAKKTPTIGKIIKSCTFTSNRIKEKNIPPKCDSIPTPGPIDAFNLLVTFKDTKVKKIVTLGEYDEEKHFPTRLITAGVNVTKKYTGRCTLTTSIWHWIRDKLHHGVSFVRDSVKQYLQTRQKRISFVPATKESKSDPSQQLGASASCLESSDGNTASSSKAKTVDSPVKGNKSYSAVAYQYSDYTKNIVYSKLSDTRNFAMVRRYIISCLGIRGFGTIHLSLRPEYSQIELANYISSAGLPLDESLRSFYMSYCKERNLISDAEGELLEYAKANRKF